MYIHIYAHMYMGTYLYLCIYLYMSICAYVHTIATYVDIYICVYILICTCAHRYSSFRKRVKHHYKSGFQMSILSLQIVDWDLEKNSLYIYGYTRVYLHIYVELFPKTRYLNLVLTFETHFSEWCLTRFGKALFICTY